MKKIYHDVLSQSPDDPNDFNSRFFTPKDFLEILRTSFMSWNSFKKTAGKVCDGPAELSYMISNVKHFWRRAGKQGQASFDSKKLSVLGDIVLNENKLAYSNLFKYKVLNFQGADQPMFDFYVNKRSNLYLNKQHEDVIISHENNNIEEGMIIIRVINYVKRGEAYHQDYIDINTKIHADLGVYDPQMRSIPWFIDQWVNENELRFDSDKVYVMSPLLHHALRIYDKILILCKQKTAFVSPFLLQQAIDATFNDARIVAGMNDKYKSINNSFIRFIPTLELNEGYSKIYCSRFFDYTKQQNPLAIFSYADVVSGGSGSSGSNKMTTDDYEIGIFSMKLFDIGFTKEENTNNGLFAWVNPDFIDLVNSHPSSLIVSDMSVLNNHIISLDHEKQVYKTSVNGKIDKNNPKYNTPRKWNAVVKKWNARNKHNNSRTFLFDDRDLDKDLLDVAAFRNPEKRSRSKIVKTIDNTDFYFLRNVNYMANSKVLESNNYARNALVAFVSSDVWVPGNDEIGKVLKMSTVELDKFFYSLRGVACEGFFNKPFLSQNMLVYRTERLKMAVEDTNPSFQIMVRNKDEYVNKVYPNDHRKSGDFLVRNYYDCKCTGKIVDGQCKSCGNPRPIDLTDPQADYWVNYRNGFTSVKLLDIRVVEDGINVYLEYSIPLANSRFKCEELTKSVPVETDQDDLGYVRQLNLGDFSISNINVPLDGVYFGLGGFKTKTNGIPFTVLRLYNALKGDIKYSSQDCIDSTDEVNEFFKDFKKSVIVTKMYDPESNSYVRKQVEAWVGMVALSPTEVSQEFNKSRSEEEKSFNKANYGLYNSLGFDDLNRALAAESNRVVDQYSDYKDELFKIAAIHSSMMPTLSSDSPKFVVQMAQRHADLVQNCVDLTPDYYRGDKAFNVMDFKKYSQRSYINRADYQNLLENYPLFKDHKFAKGFIINCNLYLNSQQQGLMKKLGYATQTIYFPSREVLKAMFEIIGDNNIRISDLLGAYIGVFESLAVCKLANGFDGVNQVQRSLLVNKFGDSTTMMFHQINGKILKAVNDELFYKEGLLNRLTNIAVPRIMSKQLTDIDCPYDVAIVTSDGEYKKIATKYFRNKYPDREITDVDWHYDFEDGEYKNVGWCWQEDIYCATIREPNLFSKQNLNIKLMWSKYKADLYYKEKLGTYFHVKHPGTKGIYLNPVFVAFNLEGDVDGDNIFLAIPQSVHAQLEMAKVFELIKDMKFFDKENPETIPKYVRDTYFVPSLKYLIDEAENLNFELDKLEIGYSEVKYHESLRANFQASRDKENVGLLTVSLWYITYFLDYYMYNYSIFKTRYNVPELTNRNKYEILFVFQYLLAQQNGVRAMKDDGSFGKLTYDSLVLDTKFQNGTAARSLLGTLLLEYKADNAALGVHIDFDDSISKLFQIFDLMFINHDPEENEFRGFGFVKDDQGKVFDYKSKRWANIIRDSKYGKKNDYYVDCSKRYDPIYFVDFNSVFLLINGRDPSKFIENFGYERMLGALEFKTKEYLHSPLLEFGERFLTTRSK